MSEIIYDLNSKTGTHLQVYEDKVVLKCDESIASFLNGTARYGEKTILYSDCVGIQFRKARPMINGGYLQFEIPGTTSHSLTAYSSENTYTWGIAKENAQMEEVAEYIRSRIAYYKNAKNAPVVVASASNADELKKFKELLDLGIISQEEFDAKKKQLLGL